MSKEEFTQNQNQFNDDIQNTSEEDFDDSDIQIGVEKIYKRVSNSGVEGNDLNEEFDDEFIEDEYEEYEDGFDDEDHKNIAALADEIKGKNFSANEIHQESNLDQSYTQDSIDEQEHLFHDEYDVAQKQELTEEIIDNSEALKQVETQNNYPEELVHQDQETPEEQEGNSFARQEQDFIDNSKSEDVIEELDENIKALQDEISTSENAIILCQSKENNPNYLSIIYANESFYKTFGVSEFNLIGKSYDFLFEDLDLDYSSEDQMEYVRLIKDVKDFHPCSIIVRISDHKPVTIKIKFKVDFVPQEYVDDHGRRHAKLIFAAVDESMIKKDELSKDENGENRVEASPSTAVKTTNIGILKNLERTLHNERLLREVSSYVILDLPIREVAEKIARTLCDYLKIDRCVIHDYKNSQTTFVAEYCDSEEKAMFNGVKEENSLKMLTEYINFQNHFYEKYGSSEHKSSLSIVEDIAVDQNFNAIRHICENYSIASQIAVTTTFNGKVNGGIYLHQSNHRSWLADEIELIEMVADQYSIAIDRSESIERVMISNHALMEKTMQLKNALKKEQDMRKMQNEFVALVSHEFKTPLQIIDSTRELLLRKLKKLNVDDSAIIGGFERIRTGIKRMNGLIHSTLNLAKMESGDGKIKVEKVIFDFKGFVEEIIDRNMNLAQSKNITIITKIDELPINFYGDPKLLEHSVTNVISNAIKYSKHDTTVKILGRANDKKVALRVIDQGMGIPKEDLANVGQKFFRAKNTLSVAGTGIGIYLSKHFVELHEGSVLIDSEVNVGTTVTITLPRIEPDSN